MPSPSTDFLPFATAAGANVESQSSYAADPAVPAGFTTGTAHSSKCNKAWRQGTFMASVVAWFTAQQLTINVPDDGNLTNAITNFTNAVKACARSVAGTVFSVNISSPASTLSVGGGPITNTGTLTVDMPVISGVAGSWTNPNVTFDNRGRATAVTNGSVASRGGSGSITVNGATDPNGTIASSGYDTNGAGSYRLWAVIQCTDGGNGVYTPSTISLAAILPSGVTLSGVTGIKSQNMGAMAGQGANATRSTCIVMSASTSSVVVTNQNSDNTGTLTSWLVEINGHT